LRKRFVQQEAFECFKQHRIFFGPVKVRRQAGSKKETETERVSEKVSDLFTMVEIMYKWRRQVSLHSVRVSSGGSVALYEERQVMAEFSMESKHFIVCKIPPTYSKLLVIYLFFF